MSCCSGKGYCNFKFPDGPPLTDYPVVNLQANYLFLPYGTLLEEGEIIRIWTENGETETVLLAEKIPLTVSPNGLEPLKANADSFLPWQLIALDSGMELSEIMDWYQHPLYNPETQTVVLKFRHQDKPKRTFKQIWLSLLYKMRNL